MVHYFVLEIWMASTRFRFIERIRASRELLGCSQSTSVWKPFYGTQYTSFIAMNFMPRRTHRMRCSCQSMSIKAQSLRSKRMRKIVIITGPGFQDHDVIYTY